MERVIVLLMGTLLVIASAAVLAPKLKIAAPLILVLAGIGLSLLPGTPDVVVDPQLILLGLLPPLLYASAMSVPVMNLRRDIYAINGLSVVLVVLTSLALGAMFAWFIPGLGFGWGVALGAILSPTDAVATTIIKGHGVPNRVAVMLDGEGLLNDATALIVLQTAIVATAVGFSFWPTLGRFALSVGVAIVTGTIAAHLNLAIRHRVREEAVNTVLSFITPFAAAVPAEMLHGSGLVAAVVAGFVTSIRAPRQLPPGHRMSDMQNWATVDIVLEGLIFLTMGLQLSTILRQMNEEPFGTGRGIGIAAAALVVAIAVRTVYVGLLLWRLHCRSQRQQQVLQPRIAAMQNDLDHGQLPRHVGAFAWTVKGGERMMRRLATRVRRRLADLEYLSRQPLGPAEAAVVIWAGMRGAVTVAAVQLLPASTPHRPLLVLIAFAVAAFSLALQGGTVGLLTSSLFSLIDSGLSRHAHDSQRTHIRSLLDGVEARVARAEGVSNRDHHLTLLRSKRHALLDARDDGMFDAEVLEHALFNIDVDELVLELRANDPAFAS